MENLNQLKDLLTHEVKDLCSAEEQIIDALPGMIEKATNKSLKKALEDHLRVTEKHRERLDQVLEILETGKEESSGGFFSNLFGSGKEKCKATEGLVKEAESMLAHEMTPEVMDAAIIAGAQKIEHYEIASYGTARVYARELGLMDVERLLTLTLDEEYSADDLLTSLAESRINKSAIGNSGSMQDRTSSRKTNGTGAAKKNQREMAEVSNSRNGAPGKTSGRNTTASSRSSRSATQAPTGKVAKGRSTSTSERNATRGTKATAGSSKKSHAAAKKGTAAPKKNGTGRRSSK
jgi:ferritin-like metal-binding protein YciE